MIFDKKKKKKKNPGGSGGLDFEMMELLAEKRPETEDITSKIDEVLNKDFSLQHAKNRVCRC